MLSEKTRKQVELVVKAGRCAVVWHDGDDNEVARSLRELVPQTQVIQRVDKVEDPGQVILAKRAVEGPVFVGTAVKAGRLDWSVPGLSSYVRNRVVHVYV